MTIFWRNKQVERVRNMSRDKGILIKLTQDELAAVKEAAKKAGKTVSEFARTLMLGAPTEESEPSS